MDIYIYIYIYAIYIVHRKTDEEEERRRVEDLKDPDSEEVMDKQTNKDRNWDDWKDMHEKGAGNKMDKRF